VIIRAVHLGGQLLVSPINTDAAGLTEALDTVAT
jgi:hypothetical protein